MSDDALMTNGSHHATPPLWSIHGRDGQLEMGPGTRLTTNWSFEMAISCEAWTTSS